MVSSTVDSFTECGIDGEKVSEKAFLNFFYRCTQPRSEWVVLVGGFNSPQSLLSCAPSVAAARRDAID